MGGVLFVNVSHGLPSAGRCLKLMSGWFMEVCALNVFEKIEAEVRCFLCMGIV